MREDWGFQSLERSLSSLVVADPPRGLFEHGLEGYTNKEVVASLVSETHTLFERWQSEYESLRPVIEQINSVYPQLKQAHESYRAELKELSGKRKVNEDEVLRKFEANREDPEFATLNVRRQDYEKLRTQHAELHSGVAEILRAREQEAFGHSLTLQQESWWSGGKGASILRKERARGRAVYTWIR